MSEDLTGKYFGCDGDHEIYSAGPCDTIEECIKETVVHYNLKPGDKIRIGQIIPFEPFVDADSVFDDLSCQAVDECGEIAEDWLCWVDKDTKKNFEAELNHFVRDFLSKNSMWPSFGRIDDPIEYTLTEEDCK